MQDNFYDEIKDIFINVEIHKKVREITDNLYELDSYIKIGKLLIDAQGGLDKAKYGDEIIKKYSIRLTNELGKKYNYKTLLKIRQFYLFSKKFSTLSRQLTFSHYVELLSSKDINEINYYIKICEEQHLSVRKLREKIKQREYERLPVETKNKLINKEDNYEITSYMKNPIIINNYSNIDKDKISEKVLQEFIIYDLDNFLEQLGDGFLYKKKQYKIQLGNRYGYIDLLLYNSIFNCYVVVELKVNEVRKQDIGQIQIYMNYINEDIKSIDDNNTIGLIVCKKDNKYVIRYSSDKRIKVIEYSII